MKESDKSTLTPYIGQLPNVRGRSGQRTADKLMFFPCNFSIENDLLHSTTHTTPSLLCCLHRARRHLSSSSPVRTQLLVCATPPSALLLPETATPHPARCASEWPVYEPGSARCTALPCPFPYRLWQSAAASVPSHVDRRGAHRVVIRLVRGAARRERRRAAKRQSALQVRHCALTALHSTPLLCSALLCSPLHCSPHHTTRHALICHCCPLCPSAVSVRPDITALTPQQKQALSGMRDKVTAQRSTAQCAELSQRAASLFCPSLSSTASLLSRRAVVVLLGWCAQIRAHPLGADDSASDYTHLRFLRARKYNVRPQHTAAHWGLPAHSTASLGVSEQHSMTECPAG